MEQTKLWWQSRIIWTSIVGGMFSILGVFGILPAELTSEMVVEVIIGVVSLAVLLFRIDTHAEIALSKPTEETGE
jgi:hypothetical protein